MVQVVYYSFSYSYYSSSYYSYYSYSPSLGA